MENSWATFVVFLPFVLVQLILLFLLCKVKRSWYSFTVLAASLILPAAVAFGFIIYSDECLGSLVEGMIYYTVSYLLLFVVGILIALSVRRRDETRLLGIMTAVSSLVAGICVTLFMIGGIIKIGG